MQIISPPSGIKNIQRGTSSMNGVSTLAVTIASVNVSKASLSFSVSGAGAATIQEFFLRCDLISATSIQFNRAGAGNIMIVWEVVEYA